MKFVPVNGNPKYVMPRPQTIETYPKMHGETLRHASLNDTESMGSIDDLRRRVTKRSSECASPGLVSSRKQGA